MTCQRATCIFVWMMIIKNYEWNNPNEEELRTDTNRLNSNLKSVKKRWFSTAFKKYTECMNFFLGNELTKLWIIKIMSKNKFLYSKNSKNDIGSRAKTIRQNYRHRHLSSSLSSVSLTNGNWKPNEINLPFNATGCCQRK